MLSLQDVAMGYGGPPVISGINLEIRAGEFFGLIGLNGEGKTTLIKGLLGLRRVEQGTIRLFGQDCQHPDAKKNLCYLPERFDPPWFLSGMEFIKFTLNLYSQPCDNARVLEYADRLALDRAALDRRVQTYSKGMRQKLGLVASLLTDCRLLVLDEPMSGLDPMARARVKDLLAGHRRTGQTVFLCSHILSDLDEICDRVGVLHGGALRFTGCPGDLKADTGETILERAFLHLIEHNAAA